MKTNTLHLTLQKAIKHHKAGKLKLAEKHYREILKKQPEHPDANHNLGVLFKQSNKLDLAHPYFEKAVKIRPEQEQYWQSYVTCLILDNKLGKAGRALEQAKKHNLSSDVIKRLSSEFTKINPVHKKQVSQLANTGQYQKAMVMARQLTERFPEDSFGWTVLGTVLMQLGNNEEALSILDKAINLDYRNAGAYNSMGGVYKSLGRLEKAVECYQKALELNPDYAEANNNLGNILSSMNRLQEARGCFEEAIRANKLSAEAHSNLGSVLRDLGHLDKAHTVLKRAVEIKPDYAQAHFNLGVVLRDQGHLEEAEKSLQTALKHKPDFMEAHANLGILYSKQGRFEKVLRCYKEALLINPEHSGLQNDLGCVYKQMNKLDEATACYRKALQINPNSASAYNNLGNIFKDQEKHEEAVSAYKKALEINPGHAQASNNLGTAQKNLGLYKEAETNYRKAIELDPNFAEPYNNLGTILQELGQLDEGVASYKKALEIKPDFAEVYSNISVSCKVRADDPGFAILKQGIEKKYTSDHDLMHAHLALGKMYADIKDYDQSFKHYEKMHEYRAKKRGSYYTRETEDRVLQIFYKVFTRDFFKQRRGWGVDSDVPIFIVGMPRSGTSLVEQILASHSRVFGAGELTEILKLVQSVTGPKSPQQVKEDVEGLTPEKIQEMAGKYLSTLSRLSQNAPRVTDKMPHNFVRLWLIALLFPQSTVLHCMRNPLDTCISCFSKNFVKGHHYVDDLSSLGHHYSIYWHTMKHWQEVLPLTIHHLVYEDLVSDPEPQTRRLLDICGLDFEETCLEFDKTQRPVQTASATQVRQKMYTTSVQRWKRYEKHLKPLMKALPDEALERWGISKNDLR
jgi:tetratricopeptide (TPR) repeat protein